MADLFTRGFDMVLSVNTAPEGSPAVYEPLSSQKGATLNRSADSIETTTKDTRGWKTYTTSLREWSIDVDGMVVFSDAKYQRLEEAFEDNTALHVQLKDENGNMFEGEAIITDFPLDCPYDDLVTYSISLTGASELTRTVGTAPTP